MENVAYDLSRILDSCYQCFSVYVLQSSSLEVCNCSVCVDDETQKELIQTPLKKLSAGLLCEYTNSAHGAGNADEVKYFLPRYFEVLASGEATSYLGTWVSLNRLSQLENWRSDWPELEVQLIESFLDALLWHSTFPDSPVHHHWDEILVMVASVGSDPCRLLEDILLHGEKRQVATVLSLYENITAKNHLDPVGYWEDHLEVNDAIVSLLRSDMALTAAFRVLGQSVDPELDARIEAAIDFLSVRIPNL